MLEENNRDASWAKCEALRHEINILIEKEEIYWKQRSCISWLCEGDRNTKFFHAKASTRKKNLIVSLKEMDGTMIKLQSNIERVIIQHFSTLFQSSNPNAIEEVVAHIPRVVTKEMNDWLMRDFHPEEVRFSLFHMHPSKAPSLDGMTAFFFQKFWHIVGADVTNAVLSCLNSGIILRNINNTHIALIPKTKDPKLIIQYHPISLCNVLYKIISKMLVNRLKLILPNLISDTQSPFILGRLITDNILVAYETLHSMKKKRWGKIGQVAIKLDMSKTYDRVEWGYLKRVMEKMGFHAKWVQLIMACITTAHFSVLVNGKPTGYILPSKGLRQGDPLSPYLFLFCAEGLTMLLRKAETDGIIKGVVASRGGPCISHLLFADDSLLFCRASVEECQQVISLLNLYEDASGQKVNTDKTSLFFSSNIGFET